MAGIPIITGFEVSKSAPIDARFVVADATERVAISWKYAGLLVYQTDNNTLYKYNGTTWDTLGAEGAQGDPGSVWYSGAGVPGGGTGIDGDYYLRTATGDVYLKAAGSWGSVLLNIMGPAGPSGVGPGDFAQLQVTGGATAQSLTTSYTLFTGFTTNGAAAGATPDATASKITINNTGKYVVFFSADVLGITNKQYQFIAYVDGVASDITLTFNSASNTTPVVNFYGVINITSAPVDIEIYAKCNTGTNDLTIITGIWGVAGLNVKGDAGVVGKALLHTEHDLGTGGNLFDAAKIATVEAGSYTPENPWSASIFSDGRADKSTPAAISGDKKDHSISYNGTVWVDNGVWRGPAGATGATGAQGIPGVSPTEHFAVIQDVEASGAPVTTNVAYTYAGILNPSGFKNQWVNNTGKTVIVRIAFAGRIRKTTSTNGMVTCLLTTFINNVSTKTNYGGCTILGSFSTYLTLNAEIAQSVAPGQTLAWQAQITPVVGITIDTLPAPRWLVYIIK